MSIAFGKTEKKIYQNETRKKKIKKRIDVDKEICDYIDYKGFTAAIKKYGEKRVYLAL